MSQEYLLLVHNVFRIEPCQYALKYHELLDRDTETIHTYRGLHHCNTETIYLYREFLDPTAKTIYL